MLLKRNPMELNQRFTLQGFRVVRRTSSKGKKYLAKEFVNDIWGRIKQLSFVYYKVNKNGVDEFRKRGLSAAALAPFEKWQIIDLHGMKRVRDREQKILAVIHETIGQLERLVSDKVREQERLAETARVKSKQLTRDFIVPGRLKFKLTKEKPKIIRTETAEVVETVQILKQTYELDNPIVFGENGKIDSNQVLSYIDAVEKEFNRVTKEFGSASYYLRFTHRFDGKVKSRKVRNRRGKLVTKKADQYDKPLFGYSTGRLKMSPQTRKSLSNDMFTRLRRSYFSNAEKYLDRTTIGTVFSFLGFTIEISKLDVSGEHRIKEMKIPKKKVSKKKSKAKVSKKPTKKPKTKKPKKKVTKKKR